MKADVRCIEANQTLHWENSE